MKVLGNALCPYMCWAKGKLLYESTVTVIQREANIYTQICLVLVLKSNAGGARGAL